MTKEAKPERCGYTGLINVGNTCFMASVLQCLANVPELRDYFRSEAYVDDINEDNVLGMLVFNFSKILNRVTIMLILALFIYRTIWTDMNSRNESIASPLVI